MLETLKKSQGMVEKILRTTKQMNNLLKVFNANESLEDLNSIDQVYESNVNIVEEIISFNKGTLPLESEEDDSNDDSEDEDGKINASQLTQSVFKTEGELNDSIPGDEYEENDGLTNKIFNLVPSSHH